MLPAVVLLLTFFLSGSHQQCFKDDDSIATLEAVQINEWTDISHSFSVAMLKELHKERSNPDENVVFSPWSIQQALLLAYFGAERETEDSIAKVLQLPPYQFKPLTWLNYNYVKELSRRNSVSNYSFKSASKLFLPKDIMLRSCIQDKLMNELEVVDFFDNKSKKYINDWVSRQTEGQITDLIKDLSPYSKGTIVNAAFFKGDWLTGFDPEKTEDSSFSPRFTTSSRVDIMVKEDNYSHWYNDDIGARTLLLPYADNRTGMIILLPDRDLDQMLDALDGTSLGHITRRYSLFTPENAFFKLRIPKFKHKKFINLKQALDRFGIGEAFNFGDYSGFTGKKDVKFDGMDHETVIEVDESGAIASAPSDIDDRISSSTTSHLDFNCNRPFVYFIYDFAISRVLVMGAFREPRDD